MSLLFLTFGSLATSQAQDPSGFAEEVEQIILNTKGKELSDVYLFTGSSSIRFWSTLQEDFPQINALNHGFGGSQMSDLLYYLDELVLDYTPEKIFIYEGDNDIANGKTNKEILRSAKAIVDQIKRSLANTDIYFISAKPSPSRWSFKEQYLSFNESLEAWTREKSNVHFIDVWHAMCDSNGEVKEDLFIEDALHMNEKGYQIWKSQVHPFVTD